MNNSDDSLPRGSLRTKRDRWRKKQRCHRTAPACGSRPEFRSESTGAYRKQEHDQNRRQQLLVETEHKGSNTDASIDPRRFGFDNIPSDLKTTKASTPEHATTAIFKNLNKLEDDKPGRGPT
ncbi:hypothetical protein F2Q70_00015991 [Brassica cretica]|uniref:Uncharacterized protein n=1 Tax=Brassica cretica TaxID=69181 RepID=A0A8S9HT33_BRACR|nr:hypothetical protein F2Q70_00015991 [Brassica cretica]